ncbi:hypothetical protein MAP00_005603 [Monascus purpureus]|nr:hypothetical protein MAP00_005603 [Monascus purpureus]
MDSLHDHPDPDPGDKESKDEKGKKFKNPDVDPGANAYRNDIGIVAIRTDHDTPSRNATVTIPFPVPQRLSSTVPVELKCCCGRTDCAVLEYNNAALEGLERDLDTAAKLGQALLHRHESYMAEAEEDRQRLVASIDSLECERLQAQAENAHIVEENRTLLAQLEGLNKAVTESDAQVKELSLALDSATLELRKLTVSANRAAELEMQLNEMEAEQIKLHAKLLSARDDERTAMQRWKHAETTLRDLHDQVDRIEKEAREERERHTELIQRMERRRKVERELDNAAGRLKGAAAASGLRRNQASSSVVSSFVRDILQDNTHLQMGIMELREMLENSNQEVEKLRDQITSHQPLAATATALDDMQQDRPATTLSDELRSMESGRVSQEVHIHHHYHAPSPAPAPKARIPSRRAKRRLPALSFSQSALHSASGAHLVRRSVHHAHGSTSSASTILSQTSASIPPEADSSMASSPQSAYRASSLFDRMDRGFESSQPTSPESSVFPSSPLLRSVRHRTDSVDTLTRSGVPWSTDGCLENLENKDLSYQENYAGPPVIPEESEDMPSPDLGKTEQGPSSYRDNIPSRSIRKASSHDSLLSVSGMDIHTPVDRNSRLGNWHWQSNLLPPLLAPHRIVSPTAEELSTPPIISTTNVTADIGPLPSTSNRSSRSLLASVAASNSSHSDALSVVSEESATTDTSTANHTPRKSSTLSSRVGGWVRGRWGTTPVSSSANPTSRSAASTTTSPSFPSPLAFKFRSPGVNQKGPILGLRPPPRAPVSVQPETVDKDLLRESLAE